MKVAVYISIFLMGILKMPYLLYRAWVRIIKWWLGIERGRAGWYRKRAEWYRKEITQAYEDKDWERASFLQQEMMRPFGITFIYSKKGGMIEQ